MQVTADFFQQTSRVLTVSELTRQIRGTLETRFGAVWVQGEISNYKLHPSGHQYFTLKDQRAQIACVIFRNTIAPLRQALVDGTQVQVYGNVSVFEARGQYQVSVQILQPRGLGLLQAKFDALKRRLDAEGLFDPARKRALPRFPRRIGIVTSPSGAAIRDLLNVLRRRAPWLQILINPVRVQGSGAAAVFIGADAGAQPRGTDARGTTAYRCCEGIAGATNQTGNRQCRATLSASRRHSPRPWARRHTPARL